MIVLDNFLNKERRWLIKFKHRNEINKVVELGKNKNQVLSKYKDFEIISCDEIIIEKP